MYWLKLGATFESDDERYENNGVIETVNNISKTDALRKHGVLETYLLNQHQTQAHIQVCLKLPFKVMVVF